MYWFDREGLEVVVNNNTATEKTKNFAKPLQVAFCTCTALFSLVINTQIITPCGPLRKWSQIYSRFLILSNKSNVKYNFCLTISVKDNYSAKASTIRGSVYWAEGELMSCD